MHRRGLVVVAAIVAACVVAPVPARAASSPPSGELLFLLAHKTVALDAFVAEVSNPASLQQYRHYLSIEALARRFGASPRARLALTAWLRRRGLAARFDPTGTYAQVSTPVAAQHALAGRSPSAAGAHGLRRLPVPRALEPYVTGILADSAGSAARLAAGAPTPAANPVALTYATPGSSARARTGTPSGCAAGRNVGNAQRQGLGAEGFTPNQYLAAYGFPALLGRHPSAHGERIAVVELGGFNVSDIVSFDRCFGLPAPKLDVVKVGIPRPLPPLNETTLDLEVLSAGAPHVVGIDVYEGRPSLLGLVEAIGAPLTERVRRPNVISVSYGLCEDQFAGAIPLLREANSILAFDAAAGISVIVSAGDTGSAGCSVPPGKTPLELRAVSFPASSPYATAAGGLNFTLSQGNTLTSELVWNDKPLPYAGGGGTSLVFSRPWWQKITGTPSVMRVVPDIAMLADLFPGYAIYCTASQCLPAESPSDPGWLDVGGTSAAAPLLAAGVADADREASINHQPPLGLLNPLLYDVARTPRLGVERSVTIGSNDIGNAAAGTSTGCCSAHRGFDAASGLGSVNVDALSRAALLAGRHRLPSRALR
jgi:subtilase family serine protease